MKEIRWAVVGTGYISNRFAQGMRLVKDARLAAVVSRSRARAEAFGTRYGGADAYEDLGEMLDRARPDIVYIGIPNDLHYACITEVLNRGVHVLSEKPMVDTLRQHDAVCALAREKGLFLMEGMWTRCFPAVRRARTWLAEGRIGEPLTVNVCFDINPDRSDWQLWKAGLDHAAGALRDVGIYALGVAAMAFPQPPLRVASAMHSNGEVDDCCRLFLDYGDGRTALAGGAFNQAGDLVARITGSEGRISIGPRFWCPSEAVLERDDGAVERFEDHYPSTGFQYEIMAVHEALRAGARECACFTLAESRAIAAIIEETRKSWGIRYAADAFPG